MVNDANGESSHPTAKRIPLGLLLSVSGSIASLVALALVFIDKLAQSRDADPQLAIWRILLAIAALLAIGATVTIAYYRILRIVTSNRTISQKVFRSLGPIMIALFLIAVFADGLYAALYWRWWLGGLVRATRPIFSSSTVTQGPQKGPRGATGKETLSRLSLGDRTILVGTEVVATLATNESDQIEGFSVASWSLKGDCGTEAINPLNGITSPIEIQSSSSYTVELRSTAFDPYLIVSDGSSIFFEDDDTGGGHNSRLTMPWSKPDKLRVVVTTALPAEGGSYTLRARCGS